MTRMRFLTASLLVLACGAARAETVTITGGPLYVTKSDCMAVLSHHPAPGVAYQPGADVHGKYVAPADMAGSDYKDLVPDKARFDVQINPMTYNKTNAAQKQAAAAAQAVVNNANAGTAAKAAVATATGTTLPKLQARQTQLAAQQAAYNAQIASQTAAIVAQTGGAGQTDPNQLAKRQILTDNATRAITGTTAYQQLQGDTAANTQALAATNASIAQNTQAAAQSDAAAAQLQTNLTAAQGAAAVTPPNNFGNTTMAGPHVEVDLKTGETTLNGKPLVGEQERMVLEACRKAGFR